MSKTKSKLRRQIILLMRHMGYTKLQIAKEMCMPPRWVEETFKSHETKLRRQREHEARVAQAQKRKANTLRRQKYARATG